MPKTVTSAKGDTMARKSRTASPAKSSKSTPRKRDRIPEPFQTVSASTVTKKDGKAEVPMLVLRGEWLKAVGFPIGSHACLTTDRRGELTLHRLGLGFPRRLYIRAAPR
jgi:hypothetical protein